MCTCRSAISHGLAPMLFLDNEEAVLEAARAFGNLSRDSGTRAIMHTTRVDEAMVLLLDHKKRDVVAAVAGVLVNLSVDKKCAGTIVDTDGIATLIDTIERAGLDDAELATTLVRKPFPGHERPQIPFLAHDKTLCIHQVSFFDGNIPTPLSLSCH